MVQVEMEVQAKIVVQEKMVALVSKGVNAAMMAVLTEMAVLAERRG